MTMILQIHIDVLRGLALKGCLDDFILLKTSELADWLGKSQQSASSYLIQLEKAGLIHRSYTRKASKIKITEAGRNVLLRRFSEYRRIFRPSGEKNKIRLTGTLETGFGEGAYYISLVHYQDQIKDKLGFEPYSGTFNIKLDLESIPDQRFYRQGSDLWQCELSSVQHRRCGRCHNNTGKDALP
jgi:riboflavin kinase